MRCLLRGFAVSWGSFYVVKMMLSLVLFILFVSKTSEIRREKRCMRHYYVETIRHPTKECELKNVLLSKCEGYCHKSRTQPLISFSPILHAPFRYQCTCCRDRLSVMKAVMLKCKGGEVVYATFRYIIRCGCSQCRR